MDENFHHTNFSLFYTPVQPCDCGSGSRQACCGRLHGLFGSSAGMSCQSIFLISVLNEQSNPQRWCPAGRWEKELAWYRGAECLRLTREVGFLVKGSTPKYLRGFKTGCYTTPTLQNINNKLYFFRCECDTVKYHLFHKLVYENKSITRGVDGPYLCKWFILGHDSFHCWFLNEVWH